MNKIEINFNTCEPAPNGGYNIMYRVQGSGDSYTNAGNFFVSPAVFYDTVNPAGTCYEGFIRTDCGVLGTPIPWNFCGEESGEETVTATWDFVNDFGVGGHYRILVNSEIVIDRTESDSGTLELNIGDSVEVSVSNAPERSVVIQITGPSIDDYQEELELAYAEYEFTAEAGTYTIHGESL